MKNCCGSKLRAVVAILTVRESELKKKELEYEKKNYKDNDTMAEHLAVISYQVECGNIKEMIEMIIKEGI